MRFRSRAKIHDAPRECNAAEFFLPLAKLPDVGVITGARKRRQI